MRDEALEGVSRLNGLLPDTTPKMIERALRDYGEEPTAPMLLMFAHHVANGMQKYKAYLITHPNASPATATSQAGVAPAHPVVREWVAQFVAGPRSLAQAAVPQAVLRAQHLMTNGKDEKVQLQAANTLMDRGGLPRSAEMFISARMAALGALATIPGALDGEVVEVTEMETGRPDERLPDGDPDPLARHRETWAKMLPPS